MGRKLDQIRCPHCNVKLFSFRLERHIDSKCPKLHRRTKPTLPPIVYRFLKPKKRCSKCHAVYMRTEPKCPDCARRELVVQTFRFCGVCGGHYRGLDIPDHIVASCREVLLTCLECRETFQRRQNHDHPTDVSTPDEKIPSKEIYEAGISGTMADPSRWDFVPGICHHCGSRAMQGSTACYSCTDK